jgi:hypothetical protein
MKNKIVRLTEKDLTNLIKKVIKENKDDDKRLKGYMRNPVFKDYYTYLEDLTTDIPYCENMNDIEEISSNITKLGVSIERQYEFTEDMKEILYQRMIEIDMDLDYMEEKLGMDDEEDDYM